MRAGFAPVAGGRDHHVVARDDCAYVRVGVQVVDEYVGRAPVGVVGQPAGSYWHASVVEQLDHGAGADPKAVSDIVDVEALLVADDRPLGEVGGVVGQVGGVRAGAFA